MGSIGVWRDFSKIKYYPNGWTTGNGTVRTFGTASALGYWMFGLSVIANIGLYKTGQQSGSTTLLNIGIYTIMLKMPAQISIPYGVGSLMYPV